MEAFVGYDLYPSLHCYHWCHHAEIRLSVHEVSLIFLVMKLFINSENNLTFVIRESLQFIAEGGSFAEEVISTIRTAQVNSGFFPAVIMFVKSQLSHHQNYHYSGLWNPTPPLKSLRYTY